MLSHLRILGGGYWWEGGGELYSQLSQNYFYQFNYEEFSFVEEHI